MEAITRSNQHIRNVGPENGGGNDPELEGFSSCIDEIFSKVNELEKRVNMVEQFYETADNKQYNIAKCSSLVKDRVKDKLLISNEKQQHDALQREATSEKRMQDLMHQFALIIGQITQHEWAWPFMQPVDVDGLGLRDYYKVVKKPMDFGTITNRMEAKDGTRYKNVREIYADVRLVFKNAMKYNDERDDIHVMARTLLEKFEEKWLQLLPKVVEEEKRRVEEEAAAQLTVKLAQEASHGKMARDLRNELYEIDMHLEKLREMVVQKCRKMTTEDKKKLWRALNRLPHEDLIRALEIVAENNPSFQAAAEEVDLDIDAQSELTLWRLKVFIEDALKVPGRNSVGMNGNNHWNNKKEDKNKNSSITAAATATTTNKNNSKRRKEICDALTKTTTKRTKKISLIS